MLPFYVDSIFFPGTNLFANLSGTSSRLFILFRYVCFLIKCMWFAVFFCVFWVYIFVVAQSSRETKHCSDDTHDISAGLNDWKFNTMVFEVSSTNLYMRECFHSSLNTRMNTFCRKNNSSLLKYLLWRLKQMRLN